MLSVQEVKWDTQNAFDSVRREGVNAGKADVVKNLLLNTDFSVDKIAFLASVSTDFVLEVKEKLN